MLTARVNTAVLAGWQQALEDDGNDTATSCAPILAEIDCLFASRPGGVELSAFVDLLERIGKTGRGSALAWSAGHALEYSLAGDLGRVTLGCRTLGAALHWACQFFPLVQDASCLKLDVGEDWTTLSYKILEPEIWPRHEDAMYTLGICAMLIKSAVPDGWSHTQITVEAEQQQVRADLGTVVQTSVVYGGNANSIRFPTSIINASINLESPCDPQIIKKLSAKLTRKFRSMPIAERTRHMIYREMNDGSVSQDQIARQLGISSRTLRRRLADERQSFQTLLDECRMRFAALEFRTRRTLSLSDMALRLGYSEHSTFSRAFARWAGMAPQEYRRSIAARATSPGSGGLAIAAR